MKKAYAVTREGLVHYVTAGEGDPLLLLHETPRSWKMYVPMIRHLGGFRVIAMDTLGFGNSDKAPANYSVADYAKNIVSFLDALGIKRIHIFGDHTGAALAVEMAIAASARVDRLVLSGLPFWLNEAERIARLEQVMARDLVSPAADGSHCARIWRYLLSSRIPGAGKTALSASDIDLLSEITLDALKAGPAWKRMEILMAEYDPTTRLPLIQSPTLAFGITGEGASIYTKRPREVAMLIPRGTAYVMEGVDGRVTYTHAKETSEIVSSYLRKTEV